MEQPSSMDPLNSARTSVQSKARRPSRATGLPRGEFPANSRINPAPPGSSTGRSRMHPNQAHNPALLQTLNKLEQESENRAFELINLRTLVLKVEKEREDALAQVKRLNEQNMELQEEVQRLNDEVAELHRERTTWRVGEWLENASGLSHVRAAAAAAAHAVAGTPTPATSTPPRSTMPEGRASSHQLQQVISSKTRAGFQRDGSMVAGAPGSTTPSHTQPLPTAGLGEAGLSARHASEGNHAEASSELEELRAQVQHLETELAVALSATATPPAATTPPAAHLRANITKCQTHAGSLKDVVINRDGSIVLIADRKHSHTGSHTHGRLSEFGKDSTTVAGAGTGVAAQAAPSRQHRSFTCDELIHRQQSSKSAAPPAPDTVPELQDALAKLTADREEQSALRQVEVQHLRYTYQQQLQERDQTIESLREQLQDAGRRAEHIESLMAGEGFAAAVERPGSACSQSQGMASIRSGISVLPHPPGLAQGMSGTSPRVTELAVRTSRTSAGGLASSGGTSKAVACGACASVTAQHVLLQGAAESLRQQLAEAQEQGKAATRTTADLAAQLAGAQAQLADAQMQAQAATRSAADLAEQLAKLSKDGSKPETGAGSIGVRASSSQLPEVVVQSLRMEIAQVSANLQENQAELSQARAEAQHARLELDLAGERVSTSAALAQEAQSGLQAAQAESARVQVDLTVAQDALSASHQELKQTHDDLTQARSDASQLRSDLTQVRSDLTLVRSDLEEARAESARLRAEQQPNADQLAAAKQHATEMQTSLAAAQKLLSDRDQQLSELQQQLIAAQKVSIDAQREVADAQGQLKEVQGQLREAQAQLSTMQSQLADAQEQLVEAQGQLEERQLQQAQAIVELQLVEAPQQQPSTELEQQPPDCSPASVDGDLQAAHATSLQARELVKMEQQLADTQAQLAAAQGLQAAAESHLEAARTHLAEQQGQSAAAQAQLIQQQVQLAKLQDQLAAAHTQLAVADLQLQEKQVQVAACQLQLSAADSELEGCKHQLAEQSAQASTQHASVADLQQQLSASQQQLAESDWQYSQLYGYFSEVAGLAGAGCASSRQHRAAAAAAQLQLQQALEELEAARQAHLALEEQLEQARADKDRAAAEASALIIQLESQAAAAVDQAATATAALAALTEANQAAAEAAAAAAGPASRSSEGTLEASAGRQLSVGKAAVQAAGTPAAAGQPELEPLDQMQAAVQAVQQSYLVGEHRQADGPADVAGQPELEQLKQVQAAVQAVQQQFMAAQVHVSELEESNKLMTQQLEQAQSALDVADRRADSEQTQAKSLIRQVSVLTSQVKQLTAAEVVRQTALAASQKAQQEVDLSRMEAAELRGRTTKMQALIREMASQMQSLQVQLKLQGSLAAKLQAELGELQLDAATARREAGLAAAVAAQRVKAAQGEVAEAWAEGRRWQEAYDGLLKDGIAPPPPGPQTPVSARARSGSLSARGPSPGFDRERLVSAGRMRPSMAGALRSSSGAAVVLLPASSSAAVSDSSLTSVSAAKALEGWVGAGSGLQPGSNATGGKAPLLLAWPSPMSSGSSTAMPSSAAGGNSAGALSPASLQVFDGPTRQEAQALYRRLRNVASLYQLQLGPSLSAKQRSHASTGSAIPLQLWSALSAVLSALEVGAPALATPQARALTGSDPPVSRPVLPAPAHAGSLGPAPHQAGAQASAGAGGVQKIPTRPASPPSPPRLQPPPSPPTSYSHLISRRGPGKPGSAPQGIGKASAGAPPLSPPVGGATAAVAPHQHALQQLPPHVQAGSLSELLAEPSAVSASRAAGGKLPVSIRM